MVPRRLRAPTGSRLTEDVDCLQPIRDLRLRHVLVFNVVLKLFPEVGDDVRGNEGGHFCEAVGRVLCKLQQLLGRKAFGSGQGHFHEDEAVQLGVLDGRDAVGLGALCKVEVRAGRVEDGDEEGDDAKRDGGEALVREEGGGTNGGKPRDGRQDDDGQVNEDSAGGVADLRSGVQPVEAVRPLSERRKVLLKAVIPSSPVKKLLTHD